MPGVNKVIIVGNIGEDPEIRYTPSGGAVANLRVATSDSWTDKQSGQRQERTEWHRIVMFNRLAEIAGEYLRKGAKIYIEGRLQTRKWQDQSGADRFSTEIVANEMQMLDRKENGQQGSSLGQIPVSRQQVSRPPVQQTAPQSPGQRARQERLNGQAAQPQPAGANASDDFDDDCPF